MSRGLIIFLQVIETLQFVTIIAPPNGQLPLDYENLSPVWNLISYVGRPDLIFEQITGSTLVVTATLLSILITY
jgi:hypothetical protein